MRCLLDTHAFLWAALAPSQLSRRAKAVIEDTQNLVRADVFGKHLGNEKLAALQVERELAALWATERLHRERRLVAAQSGLPACESKQRLDPPS